MKFRSKIGPVIAAIVWVPMVAATLGLLLDAINSWDGSMNLGEQAGRPIAAAVFLLLDAVVAWMFATTHYTITADDMLVVRSGFMRYQIPIGQIQSVHRTRNPASAPALSLDRLEITYGTYGFVLISPVEPEHFIEELRRRNPAIRTDA
jgi:hypothetical protein